jgi:uroporphyrin-3 C-methyltransferase
MSDPAAVPAVAAPTAGAHRSALPSLALLLAAGALGLGGWAAWRGFDAQRALADAEAAQATHANLLARLEREGSDASRAAQALERRLRDAEGVNQSLREELLGLGERARLLEDAVSRLAERNLSGAVLLRLNEAEFLLGLGGERLALFDDPQATIAAFQLADAELAALDDPLFTGVRQTIAAEIAALSAAPRADRAALLARLDAVADALPTLPPRGAPSAEVPALPPTASWLDHAAATLARFVRVRELPADGVPPVLAGRAAVGVELAVAKSALVADDDAALRAAVARARGQLAAAFDGADAGVVRALAALDAVLATPVRGPLPEIGAALDELRNLRATRALAESEPPAAP